MPIVVVGNVFVDIKGFPDTKYIPSGRNSGWVEFVHGGVGRNVAEDIANVELRPRFVSMVDDTEQGAAVLRKLQNHKVDTRFVAAVPDGMGLWLAIHDSTGDIVSSISKRPSMDALARMLGQLIEYAHGSSSGRLLTSMKLSSVAMARPLSTSSTASATPARKLSAFPFRYSPAPAFNSTASRRGPRSPERIARVMAAFSAGVPPARSLFSQRAKPKSSGFMI